LVSQTDVLKEFVKLIRRLVISFICGILVSGGSTKIKLPKSIIFKGHA